MNSASEQADSTLGVTSYFSKKTLQAQATPESEFAESQLQTKWETHHSTEPRTFHLTAHQSIKAAAKQASIPALQLGGGRDTSNASFLLSSFLRPVHKSAEINHQRGPNTAAPWQPCLRTVFNVQPCSALSNLASTPCTNGLGVFLKGTQEEQQAPSEKNLVHI